MFTYKDARMRDLQTRFRAICEMVDAEMEPVRRFAPNHRSEVYKAILKSLAIEDATLVDLGVTLARERFPGGDVQVYPMLHLPNDTNERGNWHRDDRIDTRRVFWIPLTYYKYPGLSAITWSSGRLSTLLAFVGSRLVNLDVLASKISVAEQTYYAWPPRMLHRGNLNTSDELSAALVIFIDRDAPPAQRSLPVLTRELVRERVAAVKSAISFADDGQINRLDREGLNSLSQPFRDYFYSYFGLRTKVDLRQWLPASVA
jgi:hypothetical protein